MEALQILALVVSLWSWGSSLGGVLGNVPANCPELIGQGAPSAQIEEACPQWAVISLGLERRWFPQDEDW